MAITFANTGQLQQASPSLLQPANQPAAIRLMSLGLVWLTIASGAVVFAEPAPVDALMLVLILALPVVGLVSMKPVLIVFLSLWLIAGVSGLIASTQAFDFARAVKQGAIAIYLYIGCFMLAAFIAKRPGTHTRLIMHAYVCAAVLASIAAIVGYFSLLPGAYDLFTKFGRAAGTFKDPNVFGPFLVPPLLYVLHLSIHQRLRHTILPTTILLFLTLAVLLSFSRGAWLNLAISGVVYGFLAFTTAATNRQRLKLIVLGAVGLVAMAGVLVVAAQQAKIAKILTERAQVVQSYDSGPEGRFGGQSKALALIPTKPFGIGALEFGDHYHHEEPHNVYLTMMLEKGWLGGLIYIVMTFLTLSVGFAQCLKRSELQPIAIIAFAAFVGLAIQGLTIDHDNWRHYYLVMALIWGIAAGQSATMQRQQTPSLTNNGDGFTDETLRDPATTQEPESRASTILGPGRQVIAAVDPEARRDRAHRPRRPQTAAYT